jgi:hypothetical protein
LLDASERQKRSRLGAEILPDVLDFARCKLMKASEFEYRHRTLIHLIIVAACFATYIVASDDIVWALVKGTSHPRLYERVLFAVAALLTGIAATIRTSALTRRDRPSPQGHFRSPEQLGNLLFSIGLGFFAPLPGFLLLVAAESIVFVHLVQHERSLRTPEIRSAVTWRQAIRQESAKWGLLVTMIIFIFLLNDRVAEILAGLSFLIWLALNCPSLRTEL